MNPSLCIRTLGAVALFTVLASLAHAGSTGKFVSAPGIPVKDTFTPVPSTHRLEEARWIDTSDRESVRNFYRAVFSASDGYDAHWTGNYETRNPVSGSGTTDRNFREATILRVNFYRALAGVPAWIQLEDHQQQAAQLTALALSQQGHLPRNHVIPSNWSHYTSTAANTALKSNLSIGSSGPEAIDGYMEDPGNENYKAGHRRWILYPQTRSMSTGDTPGNGVTYGQTGYKAPSNTLVVHDDYLYTRRPATRDEFVAYPPRGYVPHTVVYPRWTFSYPDADFSRAQVNMFSEGRRIATKIEHAPRPGRTMLGETTLVWVPSGLGVDPDNFTLWEAPSHDTVYTVKIDQVRIHGKYRSFTYDVIIFNPADNAPNSQLASLSGDPRGKLRQSSKFTLNQVAAADTYTWRALTTRLINFSEGGNSGLKAFHADLSPQKDPRQPANNGLSNTIWRNGGIGFHLAMPTGEDQVMTVKEVLIPQEGAELSFHSRLCWASPNQVAMVQVSTDDGKYWESLWMKEGNNQAGQSYFENIRLDLGAYANRTVLVRFVFAYLGGSYFPQTGSNVGWFFDSIEINECEAVQGILAAGLTTADRFSYSPTRTGNFYLQACPMIFDEFGLEWGPLFRVSSADPELVDQPSAITAMNTKHEAAFSSLEAEL